MTTPTVPTLEKVMTMAATIDPPQQWVTTSAFTMYRGNNFG